MEACVQALNYCLEEETTAVAKEAIISIYLVQI